MQGNLTQFAIGIVGGIVGAYFFSLVPAREGVAPNGNGPVTVTLPSAQPTVETGKVIRAERIIANDIQMVDQNGKLRAQLAMSKEGGSGFFIMDSKGIARVVIGAYPPGEDELPFVALNDASQNAAGLFRLVGASQVPFLIFKNQGQDRMITGLSARTPEQAFLVEINGGKRNLVFGKE